MHNKIQFVCFVGFVQQGLIPGEKYSYYVQSGLNSSHAFEFTAMEDGEVLKLLCLCYLSL